jgi:hypothetical protein
MPVHYREKIQDAIELSAQSLAPYKTYEATLTTTTDLDFFGDLGRWCTLGNVRNDDTTNAIGIAFSVDGTNFGDTSTLNPGEGFDFTEFIVFKKLRLIHSADADYRVVAA